MQERLFPLSEQSTCIAGIIRVNTLIKDCVNAAALEYLHFFRVYLHNFPRYSNTNSAPRMYHCGVVDWDACRKFRARDNESETEIHRMLKKECKNGVQDMSALEMCFCGRSNAANTCSTLPPQPENIKTTE